MSWWRRTTTSTSLFRSPDGPGEQSHETAQQEIHESEEQGPNPPMRRRAVPTNALATQRSAVWVPFRRTPRRHETGTLCGWGRRGGSRPRFPRTSARGYTSLSAGSPYWSTRRRRESLSPSVRGPVRSVGSHWRYRAPAPASVGHGAAVGSCPRSAPPRGREADAGLINRSSR